MNQFYKQLIFISLGVAIIVAGGLGIWAVNNRGVAPVLQLRLDEGYGTSAYDASGNTNTGTITNAAWKNEQQCKTGKCLFFDGTGDIITVSDSSELDPIRGVTVQTWVRPNNFDSTASLILKDTQYSLDIAQGVPNFRAYVNGLWQSAIGAARGWIFREPADNQLTGDTATFTEALGYRALTPASLTSEKGILITDADSTAAGTGDVLQYSRGSQSTPDGTNVVYENFNPYQGTFEFWLRPNWDGDDDAFHNIIYHWADSSNYLNFQKHSNNNFYLDVALGGTGLGANLSATSWTAGTWYHVVGVWDGNNDVSGASNIALYINGSVTAGTDATGDPTAVESNFSIGHRSNLKQFNGTISGRILNRPLTSTEVTALYASGSGHTDTFTVTPDTVWMGTYTDSTTTAAYWHTGKSVSAITDGGDKDTLTTASNADASFADNDRVVIYDGTGYKVEACASSTPGSTSLIIDDCSGADPGATEDVGVSLDFDATYYANAADNTVHDVTTEDISISAWIKHDASSPSESDVLSKRTTGTAVGYTLYIGGQGKPALFIVDANLDTYSITSNTNIRDNKWYHVVAVIDRDSAANSKMYIDGYEDGTTVKSGTLANVGSMSNSNTFAVGAINSAGSYKFDGQIRDVKLYYAAGAHWSDAEILYQATNPFDYGASAGTITDYWQATDANGTTTVAGSVNNLTLSSASAWSQQAFVSKNLLADPGMENGGIGGSIVSGLGILAKDTATVKFDAGSSKITNNNGATPGGMVQNVTTATGEDYLLNGWAKKTHAQSAVLVGTDGIYPLTGSSLTQNQWTFFETVFEASDASTAILLQTASGVVTDVIYIDQLQLLPNIIDNGGMEGTYADGADTLYFGSGWANYNLDDGVDTAASSTSPLHSGTLSQKIIGSTAEGMYQDVTTVVGEYYTLSGWFYSSATSVRLTKSDSDYTDQIDKDLSSTDQWEKISITFKATSVTTRILIQATASSITYYVDDVSIIKLDTAPASTVTPSTQANSFGTGKWSDTNGAFLVDGGDTLTYPTSGNINASTGTIAFWIKPNGWDGDDGVQHQLFDTDADRIVLFKTSSNKLQFMPNNTDSSGRYIYTTSALTSSDIGANTWVHLAVTWDNSADSLAMYLDGSVHTTGSAGTNWTLPDYGTNIHLGTRSTDDTMQADAYFDDIRIYDTVLTAPEISAIYNDTNPTTITANQWSHVTGVYSRDDNEIKTYTNGVLQTTYNVGSNYKLGTSTNNITIGDEFTGYLDDIKIYDEPRTASQIRSDYVSSMTSRGASGRAVTVGEGVDPSEGLVAHYTFDETALNACGTAQDACDSSSNNHLSFINDASPTSTAKYGYAATFDGTGDYACSDPDDDGACEDDDDLEISGEFTISAWIKPNGASEDGYIVSKFDASTSGGYGIQWVGSSDRIDFYSQGQAGQTSGSVFTDTDVWVHVVIAMNANGDVVFYRNGEEAGTGTMSLTANDVHFYIGNRVGGSAAGHYFNGQIDNVKIYKVARSASQIRKDYETGPPPIAHWKMDENAGDTAYDTSGSNNGDLQGSCPGASTCPTWTTGKYGSALDFDGVDDYVDVGNDDVLDLTDTLTFSAWINLKKFPVTDANIIGHYLNSPYPYRFLVDSSGQVDLRLNNIDFNQGSDDKVSLNEWYYVAVTYDKSLASNQVKFYINGSTSGTGTYSTSIGTNNDAVTIGRISYSGGMLYFNGAIDDVRIYNYARTQKQIMEDMNADHPAVGSPVGSYVGYWKFDEGYGQTVYDMSISQNNGTLGTTTAVSGDDPTWTQSGKFSNALNFDGSGNLVTISDSASLQPSDGLTITAWIYPEDVTNLKRIVSKWDGATGGTDDGAVLFDTYDGSNGGGLRFSIFDSSDTLKSTAASGDILTQNTWQFVAATFDSGTMTTYLNGVKKNTGSLGEATIQDSSFDWGIGEETVMGVAEYFDGKIDEVKIYPFALTPGEVMLEYNGGQTLKLGSLSAPPTGGAGSGTSTDSASIAYCVPGGTDACDPPVAHWKFDERSGSTMYDTAGANDGTLHLSEVNTTSTKWKSAGHCHAGSCLDFDGTDDYVVVSDDSTIDSQGWSAITIEAWVYPTAAGEGGTATIVRKENAYFFDIRSTDEIRFAVNDSISQKNFDTSTSPISSFNTWYHIAVIYDDVDDTQRIYINGSEEASGGTASGTLVDSDDDSLYIGNINTGANTFNGNIDDVRIYNYARTPAQIAWEYNRGAPVGHWKMDEGQDTAVTCNATGGTIYDYSDNSNNGTLHLSASPATSTAWVEGKYSCGIDFDGSDDYVSVTSTAGSSLDITGAITLSAWVKNDDALIASTEYIVGKWSSSDRAYQLWRLSDETYQFGTDRDGDGSPQAVTASAVHADTNWHHVVGVFVPSTSAKIYVNGVLEGTDEASIPATIHSSPTDLTIGIYSGGLSSGFDGTIDDIRIYNYALTQQQINNVYNEGSAVRFGPSSGLP